MEANEVVKLAKKEDEVKSADLPERYIEKIAKDIARYVVYGWREGHDIQLTKHMYAGFEGIYMSLPSFLWKYILGPNSLSLTKKQYNKKKMSEDPVYFQDTQKDKVYVYDPDENKEYVFCGEKTKKEALEWLAEEIEEYIEINDIADPWTVDLYYE